MNITKILPISFKSSIIDAHTHIGLHEGYANSKSELDIFVKSELPNNDTVEKMLVSNIEVLNGKKNEYQGNIELLNEFKNDSRYALIAACSPKDGEVKNIKKLYKENPDKFVGLKLHPNEQKLELTSEKYKPYLKFAEKNNLPCLFHTSVLVDEHGKLAKNIDKYSDPQLLYNLAQKHKKLPIVMAHLGAGWKESHDKAIDVIVESIKNGDANLYADISWVDIDSESKDGHNTKEHVIKAIKKLKGIGEENWTYGDQSYRLMFGSDAPLARFNSKTNPKALENYTNFIEDIKFAIKNDKDLKDDAQKIIDDLFYNNAKKLYLNGKKNSYDLKTLGIITTCTAIITGSLTAYIIHQHNKNTKKNKE